MADRSKDLLVLTPKLYRALANVSVLCEGMAVKTEPIHAIIRIIDKTLEEADKVIWS